MRYHIRNNGDMGVCKAREGNCPLKNSDGSPARHFDSLKEATEVYEKMMESKVFSTLTKDVDKVSNSNVNTDDFGDKIINNPSKKSSNANWEQPDFTVSDAQWEQPPVSNVPKIDWLTKEDEENYQRIVEKYNTIVDRASIYPELSNALINLRENFYNNEIIGREKYSKQEYVLMCHSAALSEFNREFNIAKAEEYLKYSDNGYSGDLSLLKNDDLQNDLQKSFSEFNSFSEPDRCSKRGFNLFVPSTKEDEKRSINLRMDKNKLNVDFYKNCNGDKTNFNNSQVEQVLFNRDEFQSNYGKALVVKKLLESDYVNDSEKLYVETEEENDLSALVVSVKPIFKENYDPKISEQERDNLTKKQLELTDNGTNVLKAKCLELERLTAKQNNKTFELKDFNKVVGLIKKDSKYLVEEDGLYYLDVGRIKDVKKSWNAKTVESTFSGSAFESYDNFF